ncbi:GGDEF domain-containing protein [Alteromonas sp. C1M14]|uniref:GGDEF domain-containing protein n=1 Tax=Alteromonas sp. C1M14 TaxID=2841567 RepID=UPI001C07F320|nr:GGDEF domain-containing protein [Alteromonas sp. C1M14]MBU2977842.1 GGDEF domain-containing protein [Alteromonas sp. C1M14]
MNAKQVASLNTHNDTLVTFIIRLSAFYEGMSSEIDVELATLRGHLAGKPDFTLATVSIHKLNSLFQNADKSVKKHTSLTIQKLEKAVKHFQQTFSYDEEVRKQSALLLNATHQPITNLFELQSLCLKTVALFGSLTPQGLSNPSKNPVPQSDNNAIVLNHNGPLFEEIQAELAQLIESFAKKQPSEPLVSDLRNRIVQPLSEQELLETCIAVIRMVVSETMQEASLTGRMIHRIHNTLGKIKADVDETMDVSKRDFEERQQRGSLLSDKLNKIEGSVLQSDSLEKLKADAQKHIASLSSTLAYCKEADNQEQQGLMTLLSAMQNQMVSLQKQTQMYRRKLAEQTSFIHTDPLTRLPNRLAYNEKFKHEFNHARANHHALSMAIIDIDFFKSINDRFGHQTGDKTLQVVSQHLKKKLTNKEFIARWGGEEFVLIFPSVELKTLQEKLEQLRITLAQLPFKFKQEKITITASFGGTCLKDDDDPQTIFARADEMLYQAKKNGRNCVVVK